MKTISILILISIISFNAYSQFSIGMHVGSSDKSFITGLHSQYEFNNRFTVGLNITSYMDNSNPVYFQSRLGYTFGNRETGLSIQPYTGYSYWIQNMDRNSYGGNITAGMQLRYQLTHIALLYADVNYPSPNRLMYSLGIAGKL